MFDRESSSSGLAASLTAGRALAEHRSPRGVAGFTVCATVFGAAAIGVAFLVFLVSRHCFE